MTILDLQGMETAHHGGKPRRSGASKYCGGTSQLSLLLC
ncbi:SapB/AmfS family lanthipeptide [Streptomyces purpurogeneiscleroticus]|nr:SapB/AmfS family lanthipeptide [Streptomyces purpurogeneiscleroticus]